MEQMTQELNIDNYDLKSIKKIYTTSTGNNMFLNTYTMIDVEAGKKQLFNYLMKKYNYREPQYIQSFVDSTAIALARELFQTNTTENPLPTSALPISGSSMVQTSSNSKTMFDSKAAFISHRIINIDSAYRSNLFSTNDDYSSSTSSNMIVQLNDTLDNTTSLELANVCIPFTFYNINVEHGNNFFYVQSSSGTVTKIHIESGNYDTSTIISKINTSLTDEGINLEFDIEDTTNKVTVTQTGEDYNVVFYDNDPNSEYSFVTSSKNDGSIIYTKLNNSLGWLIGFRTASVDDYNKLEYNVTTSNEVQAEALCHVPYTKYFVIVIDDLNKNQNNKGLVQIENKKEQIPKKRYFNDMDNSLNCLTNENCKDYTSSTISDDGTFTPSLIAQNGLTKKQLYAALQVNNYRTELSEDTSKLSSSLINNVFAIVPFETKSLEWGKSMFTSDKNKYKRKYVGPVNISKMNVKLLDDRGNLIDLNGAEWSFSMISTHEHKN